MRVFVAWLERGLEVLHSAQADICRIHNYAGGMMNGKLFCYPRGLGSN